MEDKKIFENRTVLEVFIERMEQIRSLAGGQGVLVMPIESAHFTGRKYLYVIGLNDRKIPVYDPSSKEILENLKEMEVAYQSGYAHEVIPLARLLDVLGNHEGVTYLSYAIYDDFQRYQDVFLPTPLYSMLKSKMALSLEGGGND